jgi:hypothetical protein
MIIGLIGKKQAGKDTIADYICKEFGFVKIGFADALKDVILILYPQLTKEDITDPILKEKPLTFLQGKSPRKLLQEIGTDVFRNHFDTDIWINIVRQKLSTLRPDQNVVISDIRFQNELDMITDFQMSETVKIFHIIRETIDSGDTHITENSCIEYEPKIMIHNNKTKEELFTTINSFL